MKNRSGILAGLISALPAVIFSACSMLMVRLYFYYRPMTQFVWSDQLNTTQQTDLFGYYKFIMVLAGTILAGIIMISNYVRGDGILTAPEEKSFKAQLRAKEPWAIAVCAAGIYLVLTLLSYIFSKYKVFAGLGWNNRFEGTAAVFCYMIMLVYLMRCVRNRKSLAILFICIGGAVFLMDILGVYQAAGNDLFKTVTGQKLITPNVKLTNGMTAWEMIDSLKKEGKTLFNFTMNDNIYQTLFNINYIPFYLNIVLSVFVMVFLGMFDKELKLKPAARYSAAAVSIFMYGFSLYNFICARSASGYFGLAAIFIVALIVFRKKLVKWLAPLGLILVVSIAIFAKTTSFWLPDFKQAFPAVGSAIESLVADEVWAAEQENFDVQAGSQYIRIGYVITDKDDVRMDIGGNEIMMNYLPEGSVNFLDADGEHIKVRKIEGTEADYEFLDDRYHDYVCFRYDAQNGHHILRTAYNDWRFLFNQYSALYLAPSGKYTQLEKVEHFGFSNNPHFGSDRGFIWSRTLPLLKSRILIGSGQDTFAAVYPNTDYAGTYCLGAEESNVDQAYHTAVKMASAFDKAHNMYLQVAVNTGVLSLIALLCIVVMFLKDCVRTGFGIKKYPDGSSQTPSIFGYISMGCFLGIIGFMVTGFFNDMSLSTSPLFFTTLGAGFAVNRFLREGEAKASQKAGI